jgi:dihydrodiol dehydrogenase / D-xylose 1-dehydrogenase (NADP)
LRWPPAHRVDASFACAALHPCRDIILQAIGSRTLESANTFGDLFGIPSRHASYEALVADPEIDVIYVGTPDRFHAEHALLALHAGKHVLVEKPFTSTRDEATAVLMVAREKGLFAMEAMWTRFVPAVSQAMDLIRGGTLGRIRMVSSDFGCQFAIPSGALNALGVYNLALQNMVIDAKGQEESKTMQPVSFHAVATYVNGVDQQTSCMSLYEGGLAATFTASLQCNSHNEALIVGEKGRIRLLGPLWHSTDKIILELNDGNGSKEQVIDFTGHEDAKFPRPFNLLNSQRLIYEAVEVNRCVREKKVESEKWTHDQMTEVMRLMEEARRQTKPAQDVLTR